MGGRGLRQDDGVGRADAVLFDLDGVLVESYEAWFHLMNAAARELGYPPLTDARFRAFWGQGPDLDVELYFTRHTVAEVESYYNRHFRDHASHVKTNSHAAAVFEALRARGCRIAVITNTPSPIAREVLQQAGLAPDALIGGTDVPHGKPAPDMVWKALELLDSPTDRAVIVGDSRFDREAAAAAGVRFLGYRTDGDRRLEDLRELLDDVG